jgi:nucleotide-binding universal stress UspA family protein
MNEIKRILAPTDFSDTSLKALEEAADFGKLLGAEVHILHVCPMLVYALAPDVVPDDPEFERRLREKLAVRLEETAKRLRARGAEIHTLLVDGNPGREIPEVAKERGFDLIVMATHGRTGWSRFTLGSVAERTVRASSVPVLTLRVESKPAA